MARFSWIILLWFTLPVSAEPLIKMELSAGLGGQAVSGHVTELKIQIYSTTTVNAELLIEDKNGLITVPVIIDELTEKILWVNITPVKLKPIQVHLLTSTGKKISRQLIFEHGRNPLTIISSSVPAVERLNSHQQAENIRPVIISPGKFPHSTQSYAGIFAIVTDAQSLSRLSLDQYHAFGNYLSGCNILLLSAATEKVIEQVKNMSGCGGKFIQSYEVLSQVSPLLQNLKSQRTARLPSPQNLVPLQQPVFQLSMGTSITLYLGTYILFITLVNWRMKKTQYLLVLPIIASAAASFVWTGAGDLQLLNWAETESGNSHIRISSLLQLGGNRMGKNNVTLADDISLFYFSTKTQQPDIRYTPDSFQREITTQTRLLSPQTYHLKSVSKKTAPYTLKMKLGKPEVTFQGKNATDKTRLLWRGQTYDVPTLAKGKSWQPNESSNKQTVSPEEKLLHRRLIFETPALLLPYTDNTQLIAANNIQHNGWLVIRPAADIIL